MMEYEENLHLRLKNHVSVCIHITTLHSSLCIRCTTNHQFPLRIRTIRNVSKVSCWERKKKNNWGRQIFLQNFLAFCSEEMDWHLAQITIKQPIILWCIISAVHIQEEDSLTSNHVVILIPSPTNTSEGRTSYRSNTPDDNSGQQIHQDYYLLPALTEPLYAIWSMLWNWQVCHKRNVLCTRFY